MPVGDRAGGGVQEPGTIGAGRSIGKDACPRVACRGHYPKATAAPTFSANLAKVTKWV
jgi:hypothetical protein